ncbi:MAG: A/G-specific adenine glycosylase [Verrucomicrobiota bacterium]|jgi:A/G-specific adenine glycosylase
MAKQTPNSEILAASKRSKDGRTPKSAWLVSALLDWFAANARDLPWRRTRDPYAIWVSEIMLQQTQVKTVLPYWKRWMRELPTIKAVANASPDKIHKLWEGLGYYTRARNLQKAAREIVEKHGGKFPQHFDDVLALPGIGRYTAGAICSIAFNQPMPILDGNVIRVLTRIFGIGKNPLEKRTNEQLWKLAEELVVHASRITYHASRPSTRTRTKDENEDDSANSHVNQSLMELGALVCLPRNPLCPVCPVKKFCVAFRENRVEELPNLGHRATTTARHFIAFIVEQTGRFLVRQRPAGVVNAHLWEFPNVEIGARLTEPQHADSKVNPLRVTDPRSGAVAETAVQIFGIKPKEISPLCTVKHSITRYRITLEAWHVNPGGTSYTSPHSKPVNSGTRIARPSKSGVWLTHAQMQQLAFTAAHRKILHVLAATGRPHCAVRSSAFRRPA